MMKLFFYCLGVGLLLSSSGFAKDNHFAYWGHDTQPIAGALAATALKISPAKLMALFPKKKIHVFEIDLDQDGQQDYIVHEDHAFLTHFIASDFHVIAHEKLGYGDGFTYYWFIPQGPKQMLALISLTGDEDSSDYALYRLDPKTWRRSQVTKIAPVVLSQSPDYKGIYWGYPWDIRGLPIQVKGGKTLLQCGVARDYSEDNRENQDVFYMVFEGIPTQGEKTGGFNSLEKKLPYQSLDAFADRFQPIALRSTDTK